MIITVALRANVWKQRFTEVHQFVISSHCIIARRALFTTRAVKVQNQRLNVEICPKLQTLRLCSTPALSRRLARRLAYSSRRQTVPVWPPCNLPDFSLCARTHLSLWPRGSRCQQAPRMFGFAPASVCTLASVSVIMRAPQEVVLGVSRGTVPGPWACLLS